ncbi:hypothetical protein H1P_2860006 [Hyella patelloides LEGE 07179]|uniref:Uncharacterized protein n=1 Tax=Hyella patelloides LEGE 07179 TaxID=945734 RepID=A0A563VTN1_9CYAN|nr:hypothetical protein [Hyella patelloides]VEP14773.1 hypothetical protein H1P_2860006 [Hyella patelloides LEGE 07179]
MKIVTDAEYDRLYRESLSYEQIESNLRGFNLVRAAKSQWSEEQYRFAKLSSGVDFEFIDEQIFLDCNKKNEHSDRPTLKERIS